MGGREVLPSREERTPTSATREYFAFMKKLALAGAVGIASGLTVTGLGFAIKNNELITIGGMITLGSVSLGVVAASSPIVPKAFEISDKVNLRLYEGLSGLIEGMQNAAFSLSERWGKKDQ